MRFLWRHLPQSANAPDVRAGATQFASQLASQLGNCLDRGWQLVDRASVRSRSEEQLKSAGYTGCCLPGYLVTGVCTSTRPRRQLPPPSQLWRDAQWYFNQQSAPFREPSSQCDRKRTQQLVSQPSAQSGRSA